VVFCSILEVTQDELKNNAFRIAIVPFEWIIENKDQRLKIKMN
jgi:hypothetical protein